jgi:hypothetical protein
MRRCTSASSTESFDQFPRPGEIAHLLGDPLGDPWKFIQHLRVARVDAERPRPGVSPQILGGPEAEPRGQT